MGLDLGSTICCMANISSSWKYSFSSRVVNCFSKNQFVFGVNLGEFTVFNVLHNASGLFYSEIFDRRVIVLSEFAIRFMTYKPGALLQVHFTLLAQCLIQSVAIAFIFSSPLKVGHFQFFIWLEQTMPCPTAQNVVLSTFCAIGEPSPNDLVWLFSSSICTYSMFRTFNDPICLLVFGHNRSKQSQVVMMCNILKIQNWPAWACVSDHDHV